jgi:hypothetical protein
MTRLLPQEEHPYGMPDFEYGTLFTRASAYAVGPRQAMADVGARHRAWIRAHGTDLHPGVTDWTWTAEAVSPTGPRSRAVRPTDLGPTPPSRPGGKTGH